MNQVGRCHVLSEASQEYLTLESVPRNRIAQVSQGVRLVKISNRGRCDVSGGFENVGMASSAVRKLRATMQERFHEHQALHIFIGTPANTLRDACEHFRERIQYLDKRDLRSNIKKIIETNDEIRDRLEMIAPNSVFVELQEMAAQGPVGKGLLLPKFYIETLCKRYDRALPEFPALPPHARISLGCDGTDPPGMFEVFIEEVVLFEEMCGLFNLWHDSTQSQSALEKNRPLKVRNALGRATINAAFSFVEAYLNGIGFDHCVRNHATLDETTRGFLVERKASGHPKFVNFRDKLLQFPKIVLGLPHPPLQESDCADLEFMLQRAKRLRDSAVHASPMPDVDGQFAKSDILFNVPDGDVERTIDSAIGIVRKIDGLVHPSGNGLRWLANRGPDGSFPASVFD